MTESTRDFHRFCGEEILPLFVAFRQQNSVFLFVSRTNNVQLAHWPGNILFELIFCATALFRNYLKIWIKLRGRELKSFFKFCFTKGLTDRR